MVRIRVIETIKDKNKIVAYRLQDVDKLAMMIVKSDLFKDRLRRKMCECVNATLTSDNRIVLHEEKRDASNDYLSELAKLATDDYQNRGGNYPEDGVPDSINVYGRNISADFKNTPERVAINWLKNYLNRKGFVFEQVTAYQVGDYHNDWVESATVVTGKK